MLQFTKKNLRWFLLGSIAFMGMPQAAHAVGPTGNSVYTPSRIASYEAVVTSLAIGTTPTDFLTITGSPTMVVRIINASCAGTATAASSLPLSLLTRTVADTGGTSTTITPTVMDGGLDPAPTAVATSYTAAPTISGSGFGLVDASVILLPNVTNPTFNETPYVRAFGMNNDKQIVLRGVANQFVISARGTAPAGTLMNCQIEWTEATN
jgi:hypothetical protein